jgi:hypothetical protein
MVRTSKNIEELELEIGINLQRKSGFENVCRKGIRIMTAELALELIYRVSILILVAKKGIRSTYMQASPRIHATATFVRLQRFEFLTINTGTMPTVKSHIPAKILHSQLIAIITVQSRQWPDWFLSQKYEIGLHCNRSTNKKTVPVTNVTTITEYRIQT